MEQSGQLRILLEKYVSGHCSRDEKRRVLELLQFPEGEAALRELMEEMSGGLLDEEAGLDPAVSNAIHSKLLESIRAGERRKEQAPESRRRFLKGWRAAAAAAAILLLPVLAFFAQQNFTRVTRSSGQALQVIILPDQSRVTLNAGSKIRYARNWENEDQREVFLEGEAFFEVSEDTSRPFVVKTSGIGISVLGTTFNVRSYGEEGTVETTLVEGKVAIRPLSDEEGTEEIVLKPNQKAVFEKASSAFSLLEVRPELYTSWKDGLLIFDNRPFSEIARELERWYGLRIEIMDETSGNCRFTIKIKNESIAEVLDLFASASGATYTLNEDKVTISGKLCN